MRLIDSCVGGAGAGSNGAVLCKAGIWSHSELHEPQGASGNVVITQVYYSDEKKFTVNSETLCWTVRACLKYSLGKNNQACNHHTAFGVRMAAHGNVLQGKCTHPLLCVHVHACHAIYVQACLPQLTCGVWRTTPWS